MRLPPLSKEPIPLGSYSSSSTERKRYSRGDPCHDGEGCGQACPLLPMLLQSDVCHPEVSGCVVSDYSIDLSTVNRYILPARFHMETTQPVLQSIQQNDWMFIIDLKNASLRVPIHPDLRQYLRFVCQGWALQVRVLGFSLLIASQVFTRVIAPVVLILHQSGV